MLLQGINLTYIIFLQGINLTYIMLLQGINLTYTVELHPDLDVYHVGFKLPSKYIKPVGEFLLYSICIRVSHILKVIRYCN